MKKLIICSSAALLLGILNSCSTQTYVSNTVNAPLLKEKGEVQLTATPNDLQAAVAVGNHIALMANGFYKNYTGNDNYEHGGMMGEGAIGYFQPIADNFVFETYVGAGAGKVHKQERFNNSDNSHYMASFDARGSKLFIQPDIGYKSRFFDIAMSSRFSFVKYNYFRQNDYPRQELEEDYLTNNQLTDPLFVFAEPAITIRGGYKFIKLQFQYGLTINMTSNHIKHPDNFSSLGIVLDIGRWYNQ